MLNEIGRRLQKKLTRKAILDMMKSGHLTIEECEVELRDLESREKEVNKTPEQQKRATMVPNMHRANNPRTMGSTHEVKRKAASN